MRERETVADALQNYYYDVCFLLLLCCAYMLWKGEGVCVLHVALKTTFAYLFCHYVGISAIKDECLAAIKP